MIFVCGLAGVLELAAERQATHVVSLLGDDPFPPTPAGVGPDSHLKLRVHDIAEPMPGFIAPEREHILHILDFAARWRRAGPMVIHCYAGVSRSTAAALAILCAYNEGRESEAATLLRLRGPHAYPNRRMVAHADELLGCAGRLTAAVEAMEPPQLLMPARPIELPIRLE